MKKVLVPFLLLVALVGGGIYFGGADLQGRFTTAPAFTPSGGTPSLGATDTSSPVLVEISSASDNDDIFMSKTTSTGAPNYAELGLASFEFTPVKKADAFTQCEFYFGAYYDGTMYPFKSSGSPTFLSSVLMKAYEGSTLKQESDSMEYNTDGSYDVPLAFDWTLTKNTPVKFKVAGVADQKSSLAATSKDMDSYDENSFDLYMNKFSCKLNDSVGTYQWDPADSMAQNKYFKIPTAVPNRGLFLTHVILGTL